MSKSAAQSESVNSKRSAIRPTSTTRTRRLMLPLPLGEGRGEGSSARGCNSQTRSQNGSSLLNPCPRITGYRSRFRANAAQAEQRGTVTDAPSRTLARHLASALK